MSTVRIVGTEPLRPDWTDRIPAGEWYYWGRFEAHLRRQSSWTPQQIDSVAGESLRILRRMHDPTRQPPFQGRGLVVGYVQSGKTANYTAVAARAADAGYRVVVVLSGIHDSLRNQTQNRLERELTGHQPGGVGPAAVGRDWICLTSPTTDFHDCDPRMLQTPAPVLVVAKKIVPVLARLDRWVAAAERFLSGMPVLLIDDEADLASINTRGNRPLDPSVSDDDDDEADAEQSPSRTNALIRSILGRVARASYVAYTATPFANILIDPGAVDRRLGDDLFPRDFVVQLPRPDGYTGTEELFGVGAQGRDVLRTVPGDDVLRLRGARRRRSAEVVIPTVDANEVPASLTDAILSFCVAGGVRGLRPGQGGKPHTMLVHVSQRKDDQARIARGINEQLAAWREQDRLGGSLAGLVTSAWEAIRPGVEPPADDGAVVQSALAVLRRLEVVLLNSDTGAELDYEGRPDQQIIAVGGNRLSRGLTLEGLTVSYFLRTTAMCDTLLQMARWYGFRAGYGDLIRIWTTDGIARWFAELALVEQSMRDSIVALERAGRRPDQMAIRLRAHSELLLTARNKARMGDSVQDSWSGEHPQTVLLPLGDHEKIAGNRTLTDRFLADIDLRDEGHGGFVGHDVTPEAIVGYLRAYGIHDDIVAFRGDLLANWIIRRVAAGELTDWSVFVASPASAERVVLGGRSFGLVRRTRISSESIGVLTDPRHEGVDLPDGPDAYLRAGGSYDADAMRAARPPTRGLLVIYPLDAVHLGVTSSDTVIALALSLPWTTDSGTTWIANRGVADG
jgi:hypothetical protein